MVIYKIFHHFLVIHMSYKIPQQLGHKEKIIFGLTFEQLLYAVIFLSSLNIIAIDIYKQNYLK